MTQPVLEFIDMFNITLIDAISKIEKLKRGTGHRTVGRARIELDKVRTGTMYVYNQTKEKHVELLVNLMVKAEDEKENANIGSRKVRCIGSSVGRGGSRGDSRCGAK